MKRLTKLFLICCIALMLTFGFTACNKTCEHIYDGACDATCNLCGETRQADGHAFTDANCTTPSTCQTCGATEGEALGHSANEDDGDCSTAITCQRCPEVMTAAKDGHEVNEDDGDCTTAVSCKYCSVVLTEAKEHNFTGEWQYNADGHYHICQNDGCNVQDTNIEHSGGVATCLVGKLCEACGYEYDTTKDSDNHASEICSYDGDGYGTHTVIHECCDFRGPESCTLENIVYWWTTDYSSCLAAGVCKMCAEETTGVARSVLEDGVYTAVFSNEAFATQTFTENYATKLASAVQEGGTITLAQSADLGDNYLYIPNDVNVVLDLNGFTLTSSYTGCTIISYGTLTIMDSVGGGTITNTGGASAILCTASATSLTIKGGTIQEIVARCDTAIEGGEITGATALDVSNDGVLITGGTINGTEYSVKFSCTAAYLQGGKIIGNMDLSSRVIAISGGSFSSDPTLYVMAGYKVEQADDMYTVVEDEDYIPTDSVTTLADFLIALQNGGEVKLGASITPVKAIIITSDVTINLNGYSIAGSKNAIQVSEGVSLSITGGTLVNQTGHVIKNNGGTVTITNCNLTGQVYAIYQTAGQTTVTNCTANGIIYADSGVINLDTITFGTGVASSNYSGISAKGDSAIICSFDPNGNILYGESVYNEDGTWTVS